jgi:hypothetical protein
MNALFPSDEYEKILSEGITDSMLWQIKPIN